jgi:hypothetical protein
VSDLTRNRRFDGGSASASWRCLIRSGEKRRRQRRTPKRKAEKGRGITATLWSAAVSCRFCGDALKLPLALLPSRSKTLFQKQRKAAEAAPHSKTQSGKGAWNHSHVVECGSVLPLLRGRSEATVTVIALSFQNSVRERTWFRNSVSRLGRNEVSGANGIPKQSPCLAFTEKAPSSRGI